MSLNFNSFITRMKKDNIEKYQLAFTKTTPQLLESFEKEWIKSAVKNKDVVSFIKKTFDQHEKFMSLNALELRAYYCEEERFNIFAALEKILNITPLQDFLLFDPNRKDLDTEKLPEKDKAIFKLFEKKIKDNPITVAHYIYSIFLFNFENLTRNLIPKEVWDIIPQDIKKKYNLSLTEFKELPAHTIKNIFEPLVPFYAKIPTSALSLLVSLQSPTYTSSALPQLLEGFQNYAIDFNRTIYAWSDMPHSALIRFSFIDNQPQALAFLLEKGLVYTTGQWKKQEIVITTQTELKDIKKKLYKRLDSDYDWTEENKKELKNLLTVLEEKQNIEKIIPALPSQKSPILKI